MQVFIWDLLPYDRHFDQFKADRHLPYPLSGEHFDREVAAQSFEQHLAVWEEMDRLGFDGVGLNEHHTTPHGLMNSPNMMAAAGAQRTKKLKFLILGELLPLHNPLRIAEEIAMADCMSRGRIWPGFARGVPREYKVYDVPIAESRARFEEAFDIIKAAWTTDVFSFDGAFWKFKDISIWPRPYQHPHPNLWVPFAGSKETIEWAARHDLSAVIPANKNAGVTDDIVAYFARCLAQHGRQINPDRLCLFLDAYVAADQDEALREYATYYLYFNQTLWHHGSLPSSQPKAAAPSAKPEAAAGAPQALDHIRPENRKDAGLDRAKIRNMNREDIDKDLAEGTLNWGTPEEVADRLIARADRAGCNSVLVSLSLGALPNDMFMEQIRRFGRDVLPRLQAHQVKTVRSAAEHA